MGKAQIEKQNKAKKSARAQQRLIDSMSDERKKDFFDKLAIAKSLPRREETKQLKTWIKELLKEFEISATFYKRNVSRVRGEGFGFIFGADKFDGHRASLRQRFAMLMQLADSAKKNKEALAAAIKELEEKQAAKEAAEDVEVAATKQTTEEKYGINEAKV